MSRQHSAGRFPHTCAEWGEHAVSRQHCAKAFHTYVWGRASVCWTRLHSAERVPHICAGQGGHVRVSPAQRGALLAQVSHAGRGGHGCVSPSERQALPAQKCWAGRTRAYLARIVRSASRARKPRGEKQTLVCLARRALLAHMCGTGSTQREALPERRCGTVRRRASLARIARSAASPYVRGGQETGVSRPHSAERGLHICAGGQDACVSRDSSREHSARRVQHICAGHIRVCPASIARSAARTCAGQGGHVSVSPAKREALTANLCGEGRTRVCLAHIARSASCTYVLGWAAAEGGRADTCVYRAHSAKRLPHIEVG